MSRDLIRVVTFVDWDSARRYVRRDEKRPEVAASRAIDVLRSAIADGLTALNPSAIFRVSLRLYHGWHRGKTKTADRNIIDGLEIGATVIKRVSFEQGVSFGDQLLCGGVRSYLYDTVRRRSDGSDEQKMIDTALVADLLQHVRSTPTKLSCLALVVGEDDDLLPGVFVADAWGMPIKVLRSRGIDNPHLNSVPLIIRRASGD